MTNNKTKIVPLDEFLSTYKQLEQAIRDVNGTSATVLDYEGGLSDSDVRDKLVQCRRIRNYAQHTPDAESFLAVTEGMLAFLKSLISRIEAERTVAGKMAKKVKALTMASTLRDVFAWMVKNETDFAPVVADEKNHYLGCVTIGMVKAVMAKSGEADAVLEASFRSLERGAAEHMMLIEERMPIDDRSAELLDDGGTLVVYKGDGRYVGIVSRKAGNW